MTDFFEVSDGQIKLQATVIRMGNDILISVTGGERPHIGSVSVSVPRPSLADPEITSSTTSTINLVGHKDNAVGDKIAASLSAGLCTNVVAACGIHIDNIEPAGIARIMTLAEDFTANIVEELKKQNRHPAD